jgi:hypothetical protein
VDPWLYLYRTFSVLLFVDRPLSDQQPRLNKAAFQSLETGNDNTLGRGYS